VSTSERRTERTDWIKARALSLGFDRVGIAELAPEEQGTEQGQALLRWLDRGDHAGMAWMARRVEERLDPGRLVPWARTAVCVALHYHPVFQPSDNGLEQTADPPRPRRTLADGSERLASTCDAAESDLWSRVARYARGPAESDLWSRVARYARGEDYHDVMGGRLERLAEAIREAFPGTASRAYVDTGPVLERALAARAGVGRMGKNTNLLHRRGSWFFLGELFLDLELEPDRPLLDMCGSCTRCLEACPTGALPEPYRLDSRRCISYWTIEHRGTLPAAVRPWLEDWVFGCDVCQEVCPWNGKEDRDGYTPARDSQLRLEGERASVDLLSLLAMDQERYEQVFAGSPLRRAKLEGLQRNAAVALGNLRRNDATSALASVVVGAQTLVRRHAAWALGQIGGPSARSALSAALRGERDPHVRSEILLALRAPAPPVLAAPALESDRKRGNVDRATPRAKA
jgi:epoxyqueuosine reductase